jgi:hypothetical protein
MVKTPGELSPTARALYWYRCFKKQAGAEEIRMTEAAAESGIPLSSLYKAAGELGLSIERGGSVLQL